MAWEPDRPFNELPSIPPSAGLDRRPVSTRTAEEICSRIRGVDTRVRTVSGVKLSRPGTGEVIFTPPEGEALLRSLLGNWEGFLHAEDDLDPLVKLAVAHYPFEAIHPFSDGNGRTGRIINSLLLVQWGLLDTPILYLSRYFLRNRAEYYRLLLNVSKDGDWEPWILYVLRGIEETAVWTAAKLVALRDLMSSTIETVRTRLPKIYSRELVEVIFEQPYCRIANLVDAGIVGRQAASRYLKALASMGLLEERPVGREVLFVNGALLEVLLG